MDARATWADFGEEPFRVFFPAAVLAGIVGVVLWPLHFWGYVPFYPGPAHIRLMAFGFFGGFILGFLGTALPRMLSVKPLGLKNLILLLAGYTAMVISFSFGKLFAGDVALLALLVFFLVLIVPRFLRRQDTPPPGFVLVGLGWACVIAGAVIGLVLDLKEPTSELFILQRLLAGQGFVLLPILGIGPFLLPRFFGMPSSHDFPEMVRPSRSWWGKAAFALTVGVVVVASFLIEAYGSYRLGHALRFLATIVYIAREFPFRSAPKMSSALGASLHLALISLAAGFLLVVIFPQYRVSLLHVTLVGGFAIITFVVATRVVFGHSGNLEKLKGRNRWLGIVVGVMLFAMATRVSGDFWPKIMVSHYTYGAILWAAAVIYWAIRVLPKIFRVEAE